MTYELIDIMLPNYREVISPFLSKSSLFQVIGSVANLDWMKRLVAIKAGVSVPESPMNFDESVGIRQVEIIRESTEPKLPLKSNVLLSVFGGYFSLKLVERFSGSAVSNLLCSKFSVATSGLWVGELAGISVSHFLLGRIAMTFSLCGISVSTDMPSPGAHLDAFS